MSDAAEKAQALMNQANAKCNSFGWFSNQKFDEAAELYKKAANQFKLAKLYEKTAEAFLKAADCYTKVNEKYEVSQCYINAGTCLKKTNINEAIKLMKLGIEYYTDEGRLSTAAKHLKEIAEMCEGESQWEKAIENYLQAADYYEGDGQSNSHKNNCLLKVAQYYAQLEKYEQAIELYEKVATEQIENNLLKWSVKDHLFKASLCRFCQKDLDSVKRALEKYQELDHTFSTQREFRFLQELVEACDQNDVDKFQQAVNEFDSLTKLDQWKTTMLLRIKKVVEEEEDLK